MTSTNPAFVKAFARRNHATTPPPQRSQQASDSSVCEALGSTAANPQASGSEHCTPDIGMTEQMQTQMNPGNLGVWVDLVQDQYARADQPATVPSNPHIALPNANISPISLPVDQSNLSEPQTAADVDLVDESAIAESLQHIHTAYANAAADLGFYRMDTTQTPQIRSVPPVASEVDSRIQDLETESRTYDESQPLDTDIVTTTRVDPIHGIERRVESLSTSQELPVPLVPFRPVWEVDVFDIPRIVADLFFDGELFQQIAERMGEAVNRGLNTVLVTSVQRGEGRSSVAIGIAMAAAAAGIRVALVDADTETPSLADDLCLDLQYGWVDTIRAGLPIAEVAVHAVEDGVTLIPLMPPAGSAAATSSEVGQLLDELRNRFDLVVIDGPPETVDSDHRYSPPIDSAIIVQDVTRSNAAQVNRYSSRLREQGMTGVGVVENFT